jgi:hypothetical protein
LPEKDLIDLVKKYKKKSLPPITVCLNKALHDKAAQRAVNTLFDKYCSTTYKGEAVISAKTNNREIIVELTQFIGELGTSSSLFRMKYLETATCLGCGATKAHSAEQVVLITRPVIEDHHIDHDELTKNVLGGSYTITSNTALTDCRCAHGVYGYTNKLQELPRILFINFANSEYEDWNVDIPEYLDFSADDKTILYTLRATVSHTGDKDHGHFYSFNMDKWGSWYKCNDTHIAPSLCHNDNRVVLAMYCKMYVN